jgi:hypothetical protein
MFGVFLVQITSNKAKNQCLRSHGLGFAILWASRVVVQSGGQRLIVILENSMLLLDVLLPHPFFF